MNSMTNREKFIAEIEELLADRCKTFGNDGLSEEARTYFESLKNIVEKEKPLFTENGAKVLKWMQENYSGYNNILKAKDIGEGLFCSSRTVSGAIRKLITDGFVSKTAGTPVCYSLTEAGMTIEVVVPEKTEEEDN
jgi:DNA-binding MarR family transcriptional regulator